MRPSVLLLLSRNRRALRPDLESAGWVVSALEPEAVGTVGYTSSAIAAPDQSAISARSVG